MRGSAAMSTLISGGLVFLLAGVTDVYEVLFKSTGIILGTLVAIYMIGKSHCFDIGS
jgi:glycopeptide antibiotics resistance protein